MEDDFIQNFLDQKTPAASTAGPQIQPTGERDFIHDFLHPELKVTEAAMKENVTPDELESRLKKVNRNLTPEIRKSYDLQQRLTKRRNEYNEKGVGAVQAYKQFFQPFGDIVTLVPFGDRSVGQREYQKASEAFKAGTATDDDIDKIATFEALQNSRKNLEDSGVGGKFVSVAGDLGKMIPELMSGELILAGGAKAYQAVRGAKSATDASRVFTAGATAEGGLAESQIMPSLLSQGTRFVGKQAALTALSPSMFVPMAQQINQRESRPANDIRGFPTAYGYGVASNLAIGHLRTPDKGSLLGIAAKKGGIATVEMNLIEDTARLMDEVIPKSYQTGTEGSNVSKVFRGIRENKEGSIKEGLEHSLAQVVAFGLFGAIHREPGAVDRRPDAQVKAWDTAVSALKERGISENDAGVAVERINNVIEMELQRNPYLDRAEMKKLTDKVTDPTLKEYAERIVESTVPDKSYGRMHDEVSKWLDENKAPTTQSRITPRGGRSNIGPYGLYTPVPEKPVQAGGVPRQNLRDPLAGAESERLFKRLMNEGFDQNEASVIAQRVYEQTAANNKSRADAKITEEKPSVATVATEVKAGGNPAITNKPPKETPVDSPEAFADISYGDLRRAAKELGLGHKIKAGGKPPTRANIIKDILDLGMNRTHVDKALEQANKNLEAVPSVAKKSNNTESELMDVRNEILKNDGDFGKTGISIRQKINDHLSSGGKVSLWFDGKEIPVSSVDTSIRDEAGAPWGIGPLAMGKPGTKNGIEFHPITNEQVATVAKNPTVSDTLDTKQPAWMQEKIQRDFDEAKKVGVIEYIEKRAADGLTRNEIAREITSKFPTGTDVRSIVNSVRSKLGIPSQEIPQDFKRWQDDYRSRNSEASVKASKSTPEAKSEKTDAPTTEPVQTQPGASQKATVHELTESRLLGQIESDANLSSYQKFEYSKAVSDTISILPDVALHLVDSNLKQTHFYQTPTDASIGALRDQLEHFKGTNVDTSETHKELDRELALKNAGERASGAARFTFETGTIHSDGSITVGPEPGPYPGAPREGGVYPSRAIWAHELGHAIDGKGFKLSTSGEFQIAFIREIKNKPGEAIKLTEYAGRGPFSEGFAEFCRILYGSDLPTAQIARDFPLTSKFFKDRGLWPAERGGIEKKPEEVFNKRVGTDENHVDMKVENAEQVATVATEKSSKKIEVPIPEVSEKRPSADRKYIESLREGKDDATVDALDTVLHNMAEPDAEPKLSTPAGSFASTRRMNTLESVAQALDQLRRGNMSEVAQRELSVLFQQLGGHIAGDAPGSKIKFDPALYLSDHPLSSGQRVEVVSQPLIGTDHKTGNDRTLVKGKVVPAEVASTSLSRLEQLQKTWAALRPSDRKKVPEIAEEIEKLGGSTKSVRVDDQTKLDSGRSEAPLSPEVQESIDSARARGLLTEQEYTVVERRLRNLTLEQAASGIAKAGGSLSRERARQIEVVAWNKLQKHHPALFGEHTGIEAFIKSKGAERLAERQDGSGTAELRLPPLREIGEQVKKGMSYDSSIRQFLRRWLTAAGGLTDKAFAARLASDGRLQAKVAEVRSSEKDLAKALGGFRSLTADNARLLNSALTDTPEGLASVATIKNTFANGADIVKVLKDMRRQVDVLSKQLIDEGVAQGNLATVFQANIGMYLTRSYRVFTDPKWENKVPEEVKNRFISWLRAELTHSRSKNGQTPPTELELQGEMENLLVDGTAAENPLAMIARSQLGSRDLSILKARKDIPPEIRALWGEVEDPLANYATSVARMSTLLENNRFLSRVRREGLGEHFFETIAAFKEKFPDEAPVQIAPEGSKAMGALAGLYTTRGLKDAFARSVDKETLPWYLQHYMKLLSMTKYAKTLGSWVTHFRNFSSNAGFAIANGHYRLKNFGDAMKSMRDDTPAGRAEWQELLRLGVIGEGVHANEFRDIINDALGIKSPFAGVRMDIVKENRVADWVKKGYDVSQKLYNAEDAVWKVFAFKNEVSRYEEAYPEWSDTQVRQKAAEIVRNTYPTYSMVSPLVRAMRRFPLAGSFVSFPAEVIRTTYHTVRLALSEIADPKTRSIGYTRLSGMITAGLLSAAISTATAAMTGIDAEDDKNMRRFMPEWSKNSLFLHLGKDQQGRYRYIDLSRNDPHSYLTEAVMAAIRSKSIDDGALAAANAVAKPFIEEEIGTRALLDVVRNTKEEGGNVYNPQAPTLDKATDVAKHIGEPFTPGSYSSARRTSMALAGGKEQKSGIEYDPKDEVLANFGLRISPLDPARSIEFRAKSYTQGLTQSANLLTVMLRAKGDVSPEELATVARESDTARKAIFDEFQLDIKAAEELGMSRPEIRNRLKTSGMSQDEISRVMNNNYKSFKPDIHGATKEYRERALMLRQQK